MGHYFYGHRRRFRRLLSALGILPFADTFNRGDGALGGPWTGADATVSSNEAIITPSDANRLTNPGFATDSDWAKGTGWSIGGGVASCDGSQVSNSNLSQSVSGGHSIGTWYYIEATISSYAAGTLSICPGGYQYISGSANGTYRAVLRLTGSTPTATHYITANSTFQGSVDNAVNQALTLANLFASVEASAADVTAQVELDTVVAGTQAGLVLNLDSAASPANFVIAYHDGTNAKLDKCVAGTYTSVISAAAAYSAGKTLRVVKSGTSYSLYYNGNQIGTTQTVSDAGIINNTLHGLFSTYSGNQLDNYSLEAN